MDRLFLRLGAVAGFVGVALGAFGAHALRARLYVLALTGTTAVGIVTPLGGLCFLAGWACLALAGSRAT